jgi:hypothetical protein
VVISGEITPMTRCKMDDRYLAELRARPLDLRGLTAPDAARALYEFVQTHFEPGDECSLWSPEEAESRGYSPCWRVTWEAGPAEWGVLLTLGESMWLTELELHHDHRPEVLLQSCQGWYTEPHHRFDVGFVEDGIGLDCSAKWSSGRPKRALA